MRDRPSVQINRHGCQGSPLPQEAAQRIGVFHTVAEYELKHTPAGHPGYEGPPPGPNRSPDLVSLVLAGSPLSAEYAGPGYSRYKGGPPPDPNRPPGCAAIRRLPPGAYLELPAAGHMMATPERPDNVATARELCDAEECIEEVSSATVSLCGAARRSAGRGLVALQTGPGVTSEALAPYLAPQRAGDPLGLGIAPGERPPAPPDPDAYDRARENAEYARSLLDEEELRELDEELAKEGFMPIEKVRDLVLGNTAKGSVEAGGLDPEIMALVDARIDYKIFIAGDNLYTREELYDHYPFHEFSVQPEAVFARQEIGIFPPRKHALKEEFEYIARDDGDESVDFVMLEDLVGQAARRNYRLKRAPLRVVKTKIYVGKERWEDFALLQRFYRGAARVGAAQIAYQGGGGGAPFFAQAFGSLLGAGSGGARGGAPLLMDRAGLEAALAAEQQARAAHEAAMAQREAEMARREAETAARAAEVQRRIDADLRRVEAMLAAAASHASGAAAPHASAAGHSAAGPGGPPPAAGTQATAPPGGDPDDSVPLF